MKYDKISNQLTYTNTCDISVSKKDFLCFLQWLYPGTDKKTLEKQLCEKGIELSMGKVIEALKKHSRKCTQCGKYFTVTHIDEYRCHNCI